MCFRIASKVGGAKEVSTKSDSAFLRRIRDKNKLERTQRKVDQLASLSAKYQSVIDIASDREQVEALILENSTSFENTSQLIIDSTVVDTPENLDICLESIRLKADLPDGVSIQVRFKGSCLRVQEQEPCKTKPGVRVVSDYPLETCSCYSFFFVMG